jgi:hypothetical protein
MAIAMRRRPRCRGIRHHVGRRHRRRIAAFEPGAEADARLRNRRPTAAICDSKGGGACVRNRRLIRPSVRIASTLADDRRLDHTDAMTAQDLRNLPPGAKLVYVFGTGAERSGIRRG